MVGMHYAAVVEVAAWVPVGSMSRLTIPEFAAGGAARSRQYRRGVGKLEARSAETVPSA